MWTGNHQVCVSVGITYSLSVLFFFGNFKCIGELYFAVEGTTRRAKIACKTRVVPEVFPMVIMSQVYKQTLAKSSDTLVGAHVRIHRCNESFIYLLSPLR